MAWENAKNKDLEKVKQVLKSWKNIGIYEKKEAVIKKIKAQLVARAFEGKEEIQSDSPTISKEMLRY